MRCPTQSLRPSRSYGAGPTWLFLLMLAIGLFPGTARDVHETLAAPPLYWCPDRTADQQYAATAEPGCTPLVGQQERERSKGGTDKEGKPVKPLPQVQIENLQSESAAFLREYRKFLDCCVDNLDDMDKLNALEDKAAAILLAAQDKLFSEQMKMRGFTLQELIPPVVRARDDLRKIRARFKSLDAAYEKAETLDYEGAGKTRRQIREDEEALRKDFRPTKPPEAPRAGSEIGTIMGTGPTSLPNRVGTNLGSSTLPSNVGTAAGPDQSTDLRPRVGVESSVTTLPNQTGTILNNTDLRSGTGFELGGDKGPTGASSLPSRAGPSVGDSDLNSR